MLLEKRHTLDEKDIRVSTAQRRGGDGSVPQERLPADKFRQENEEFFGLSDTVGGGRPPNHV